MSLNKWFYRKESAEISLEMILKKLISLLETECLKSVLMLISKTNLENVLQSIWPRHIEKDITKNWINKMSFGKVNL